MMKIKFEKLFSEADLCINLVGILYESKKEIPFKISIPFFQPF